MRKFKYTRFATAMALAAGVALPAVSSASSFDLGATPQIEYGQASKRIADEGDLLLFPYYTVRDGRTTSFSITNSDDENSMAVKLRFREAKNSEDVLDIVVVLSPDDVLAAYVKLNPATGRPQLVIAGGDETCRVPMAASYDFPSSDFNEFVDDDDDMLEGHFEVYGMATLATGYHEGDPNPGEYAVHDSDDKDCGVYEDAFKKASNLWAFWDSHGGGATFGGPGGDLYGEFAINQRATGLQAGGRAMAIRDSSQSVQVSGSEENPVFRGPLWPHSSEECGDPGAVSLPTDDFNGPYDGCIMRGDLREYKYWDHPNLGDLNGGTTAQRVRRINNSLNSEKVFGAWSTNPANGAGVQWVLTLPTKYMYSELDEDGIRIWNTPFDEETGCIKGIPFDVWDREENKDEGDVVVSPGETDKLNLCTETSVLNLAPDTATPINVLGSALEQVVAFKNITATAGWARMYLGNDSNSSNRRAPAWTGFAFTQRDMGAGAKMGSLVPLGRDD